MHDDVINLIGASAPTSGGPSRWDCLARALKIVRAYATGGQKSVHECWLEPGELAVLKHDLEAVIDAGEDSVLFVRLDPRMKPRTLGIARPSADPSFFFVG